MKQVVYWSGLVLVMLFFVGCDATSLTDEERDSARVQAQQAKALSGKIVFRGLFFGEGLASARLPELWGNGGILSYAQSAEERREMSIFIKEVILYVEQTDSGFFESFGVAIQSGNPLRVKEALGAATQHLLNASTVLYGVDYETALAENDTLAGSGQCFWGPVAVAAAAFYLGAAAVNTAIVAIAIAVYELNYLWPKEDKDVSQSEAFPQYDRQLQREQFVDTVTTRFKV